MFILISDFLIDEQISSALLVEQKQFRRNKEKLNNRFPYENAMKILKIINNMGKTGQNMGYLSGMNYLDAF